MLLVTVIAVEAIVLWQRLSLKLFKAFGVSALANIASAILGTILFPLAEGLADAVGFDMYDPWTSKTLFFLFLVPNYLLSVWLEVLIAIRFVKNKTYGEIKKVFYSANIYSYLLLAAMVILIPLPIG